MLGSQSANDEEEEKLFHFDNSAGYLWWLRLDNFSFLVHQCSTETLTFYEELEQHGFISEFTAVSSAQGVVYKFHFSKWLKLVNV